MQPNKAFKRQNVPGMIFRSSFNATKSHVTFFFDGLFRHQAYIHPTHDGKEKQGEPERDRSRMQRTFDGRLFQTTAPEPET